MQKNAYIFKIQVAWLVLIVEKSYGYRYNSYKLCFFEIWEHTQTETAWYFYRNKIEMNPQDKLAATNFLKNFAKMCLERNDRVFLMLVFLYTRAHPEKNNNQELNNIIISTQS